jgi:membrane protein
VTDERDPSRLASARARAEAAWASFDERYGSTPGFRIVRDVFLLDRAVAGGELAAALAYRLFLWFLPFVLLLVAGLGVYADALDESPEDAAEELGLAGLVVGSVGEAAQSEARWYAILIGIPILLYLTRSLVRTLVAVHRLAWRLEPVRGHVTSKNVLLFLGALVVFVAIGGVTTASASWPVWAWLVTVPAVVLARAALWLGVSSRLPRAAPGWIPLLPGAAVVGIGFLGVNVFTLLVIEEIAAGREDAYGAFGVAATVLFSLWLSSRVIVVSAVANAALWARSPEGRR